jgi:hypothetical protein
MSKETPPDWTAEELKLLKHESFISEVNRVRGSKKETKPVWQTLLESTGGTALITVLLGGIIGGIISSCYQQEAKDREFQQSWLKAQGDKALASYHEHMKEEKELLSRIHTIVGNCLAKAEDLVTVTDPIFTRDYDAQSRKNIRVQQETAIKAFNEVDLKWRSEKAELTLLISYYHPGEQEVHAAWVTVKDSMTQYMICAEDWFKTHLDKQEDTKQACSHQKKTLEDSLGTFSAALVKTRQYAWEGWESPELLRQKLDRR